MWQENKIKALWKLESVIQTIIIENPERWGGSWGGPKLAYMGTLCKVEEKIKQNKTKAPFGGRGPVPGLRAELVEFGLECSTTLSSQLPMNYFQHTCGRPSSQGHLFKTSSQGGLKFWLPLSKNMCKELGWSTTMMILSNIHLAKSRSKGWVVSQSQGAWASLRLL